MPELILLRHGETDSNVRRTYCGWTDAPLNARGMEQAKTVRKKLDGIPVTAAYASPLSRAVKTAEIVCEGRNLPLITADDLKEHNFGIWEDMRYEDIIRDYSEEAGLWKADWMNYCIRGGESGSDVYKRTSGFIDSLIAENGDDGARFLIITHLGCIRYVIVHLLGFGIGSAWRFWVDNCGITRITANNDKYPYMTMLNG